MDHRRKTRAKNITKTSFFLITNIHENAQIASFPKFIAMKAITAMDIFFNPLYILKIRTLRIRNEKKIPIIYI